jgi:hypothetical protein
VLKAVVEIMVLLETQRQMVMVDSGAGVLRVLKAVVEIMVLLETQRQMVMVDSGAGVLRVLKAVVEIMVLLETQHQMVMVDSGAGVPRVLKPVHLDLLVIQRVVVLEDLLVKQVGVGIRVVLLVGVLSAQEIPGNKETMLVVQLVI